MLRISMEDMEPGEVAVLYQDGEDAIILVTADRSVPDTIRCGAVDRLLRRIKTQPVSPIEATKPRLAVVRSIPTVGVLLPHLREQVTSATG